ncbi:hypothetical protein HYN56_19070 [Flavobacterium crocinum]|uniref:Thioredoxin domain-containing protein n=1 Tax=Flavobacterium crocinum TaxID=2183896 RepID=A0A2S1YQ23_9FLAO|nr:TlpA disulfide reductase family protein [Flavobacterium crocinum]AWK06214.1 hypothetical protein HYN56_19070 [Flavobacterium crocinum]
MKIKKVRLLLVFMTLSLFIPEVNGQTANKKNNKIADVSKEKTAVAVEVPKEIEEWMNSEFLKIKKQPIADFNSSDFYNKTNGRLIGYINGYNKNLGFTTGIVYWINEITSEDLPAVIQIHPDGRFEADLPLSYPIYLNAIIKDVSIPLYIEPGQVVACIVDIKDLLPVSDNSKFKKVFYKGTLEQINNDLLNFDYNIIDFEDTERKINSLPAEDFKSNQFAEQKENLESLDNYIKSHQFSSKAAVIIKNDIYLKTAINLFEFPQIKFRSLAHPDKKAVNTLDNSFYNFLKEFPLNDQSLLVSSLFGTFENLFEFSQPFSVEPSREIFRVTPEKNILAYLDEQAVKISKEDRELLNAIYNSSNASKTVVENRENKVKQFREKYRKEVELYNEKYVMPLVNANSLNIAKEYSRLRDSVVTNVLGLQHNLVYDITKVRKLKFDTSRADRKKAMTYWENQKKEITTPFVIEEGNVLLNQVFPSESSKAYVLPPGKATDIFNKIINPFKGKILFVDFWSTSCAPCVGNIKNMKEIRRKYEGNKDFEFLFITEETESPLSGYSKFIKDQELKNSFRLSVDDYNYLRQLFKFEAIPKYFVIDKKGNVLIDGFQMHNFEFELKSVLELGK